MIPTTRLLEILNKQDHQEQKKLQNYLHLKSTNLGLALEENQLKLVNLPIVESSYIESRLVLEVLLVYDGNR